MTRSRFCALAPLFVALAGCSASGPPPVTVATARASSDDGDHHGHAHDRKDMMAAHAGRNHAWLTAHLSIKDGNELDIFFDSTDEADPKPVALPVEKFTAKAVRVADGKEFELTYEPAPADERPKDEKPGTYSHFVAKAPWMTADDVLTITAEVEVDGRKRRPKWIKFEPKRFAHHVE